MKVKTAFLFNNVIFIFILSFLINFDAYAIAEFPDTPAGNRAKEIINLINGNSTQSIKDYINKDFSAQFKDSFPVSMHLRMFEMVNTNNGRIELVKVSESTKEKISFICKAVDKDRWLSITVAVESGEPHLIATLGFSPASKPEGGQEVEHKAKSRATDGKYTANKISEQDIKKYLDEYIDELIEEDEFSGTVLVAKDGKPIYTNAVGLAHKGFKVPNKLDTKFCLGSMNKMFTGTAIMQLVQQGKIKVDDKVGKFLPDYPNDDVREKVTVHHLLSHTSGMGLYWMEYFGTTRMDEIKTVKDYDNLANKNPLLFEPGERFSYSNCGPLVLGLIIEKISGLSYDEYIRTYVTGPAGMSNTDCYDISIPVENLAVNYTNGRPLGRNYEPRRVGYDKPLKGGPAGGGYSTVEDLLKFDIALRNNKLLDKEHFILMTTGKTSRSETNKYAYLFQEKFVDGHRIIGHNGGAGGINSHLSMYMDLGYTVAVMSNYDPPAAENVAKKLEELLIQK